MAIDSTEANELEADYFVAHPRHRSFLEDELVLGGPGWRIPFTHHPPYCAGPKHGDTAHLLEHVVPLLQRGGVRTMFCGHEHNFQHNIVDGIHYVVTGSAGKLRDGPPNRPTEAGTRVWAAAGHFLIVDVDAEAMTIHPVTDVNADGTFRYLEATTPNGEHTGMPITVER